MREVIESRYVVVSRDSHDDISTTWIAKDFVEGTYVRLKILKGKSRLIQAILKEVEYHQWIQKYCKDIGWAVFLANCKLKTHAVLSFNFRGVLMTLLLPPFSMLLSAKECMDTSDVLCIKWMEFLLRSYSEHTSIQV